MGDGIDRFALAILGNDDRTYERRSGPEAYVAMSKVAIGLTTSGLPLTSRQLLSLWSGASLYAATDAPSPLRYPAISQWSDVDSSRQRRAAAYRRRIRKQDQPFTPAHRECRFALEALPICPAAKPRQMTRPKRQAARQRTVSGGRALGPAQASGSDVYVFSRNASRPLSLFFKETQMSSLQCREIGSMER